MDAKDSFQKYLDAGIAFTSLTRAKAEELVGELVQSGAFQSSDARARVDELLERSRKSREAFTDQVRKEVGRQLESVGITSIEDLAQQVASLIGRTADAGKAATSGTKAAPTKAAAKKSPARKSAGTKAAATKAAATKAAATKAATKKAAATRPAKATKASPKKASTPKAAAKASPKKEPAAAAPTSTAPPGDTPPTTPTTPTGSSD